ncbi:hypothetical protein LL962_08135 [Xanthomonas sp. NCPPB 1067]|uniref:Uncharacterized protein n=1 Tax=Xanthomonas melonis TaxID=56456 RepID=A0A2S7DL18_9XANT|nr:MULTISPECIES: hypothetical protein [Xanthomonas]MCC4587069.1 hypothetical protein [Xanthomonas sp. NCPPB 1067]MCC4601466.1 hypothetical protein [Xanthomonas melonis]PPU74545.1 hypothetical protein XmelCFBP4644_01030 [Xanthomonas melonis]
MLKIQVGSVFHIWCSFCRPPKWKFFVVATMQPELRYFVINSNPASFQRIDDVLMGHQVQLLQGEHYFLRRDSVLDCSELVGGPTASDLEDRYAQDARVLLGRLSTPARRAVRAVTKDSVLLSGKEVVAIQGAW